MTIADLIDRVLAYAASSSRADALDAVNDTIRFLHGEGRYSVTSTTATLTTSASSYDLSVAPFSMASVYQLLTVEYLQSGTSTVLEELSVAEILDRQTGDPVGFPRAYALMGEDTFLIDPMPLVGDTLRFNWLASPTAYVDDTTVPTEVPVGWHRVIAYGAACEVALGEGPDLSERLEAKYERAFGQYKAWIARRRSGQQRRVTVGYVGRRPGPSADRSRDLGW